MLDFLPRFLRGALLAALAIACCYGQAEITGRIGGTITDDTKAAISEAIITITSPALFSPKSTLSGPDGTFFVDKLPPVNTGSLSSGQDLKFPSSKAFRCGRISRLR